MPLAPLIYNAVMYTRPMLMIEACLCHIWYILKFPFNHGPLPLRL